MNEGRLEATEGLTAKNLYAERILGRAENMIDNVERTEGRSAGADVLRVVRTACAHVAGHESEDAIGPGTGGARQALKDMLEQDLDTHRAEAWRTEALVAEIDRLDSATDPHIRCRLGLRIAERAIDTLGADWTRHQDRHNDLGTRVGLNCWVRTDADGGCVRIWSQEGSSVQIPNGIGDAPVRVEIGKAKPWGWSEARASVLAYRIGIGDGETWVSDYDCAFTRSLRIPQGWYRVIRFETEDDFGIWLRPAPAPVHERPRIVVPDEQLVIAGIGPCGLDNDLGIVITVEDPGHATILNPGPGAAGQVLRPRPDDQHATLYELACDTRGIIRNMSRNGPRTPEQWTAMVLRHEARRLELDPQAMSDPEAWAAAKARELGKEGMPGSAGAARVLANAAQAQGPVNAWLRDEADRIESGATPA